MMPTKTSRTMIAATPSKPTPSGLAPPAGWRWPDFGVAIGWWLCAWIRAFGGFDRAAVVQTWHLDLISAAVIALLASAYASCYRRGRDGERPVEPAQAGCFGVGMVLWVLATLSFIGSYAYVLFWVRALQVLMLLYVVPFFLAQGKPVTVVRAALGPAGRDRVDRLLASRWARVLAHPLTTSLAMLATPWLLYLTPWYTAALESEWIGAPTRILLVVIGFGYFYAACKLTWFLAGIPS